MRNKRVLFSMLLSFILIFTTFNFASAKTTRGIPELPKNIESKKLLVPNKDIEITLDKNGNADAYVVMYVDKNGKVTQLETESAVKEITEKTKKLPSRVKRASSDDFAIKFHISLFNWGDRYADLSWTADSTMPNITGVHGSVFVKSTSILNPKTYYSKYFEMNRIGGQIHAEDYIGYADLEEETSVRVSFGSVVVETVQQACHMSNSSYVVKKK